jgi:hypothetical protein
MLTSAASADMCVCMHICACVTRTGLRRRKDLADEFCE